MHGRLAEEGAEEGPRKDWKDPRGANLSGREDLNLRPFGPEPGPEPSPGGNRRQLCAILTVRGWGRVQRVAGFWQDFPRICLPVFYPTPTRQSRTVARRRRRAGRRHAGAEDATVGQPGPHAGRPAGPLGRARSAAEDSRGGGAPRRVERDRLWALRARRAALRLARHLDVDPTA
jgi:hypothetical protein